jgi:hypothetical protein
VVAHYTCNHTVNSVPAYLSAIQHLYNAAGAGKLPRDHSFKEFTRGLSRLFGTADEVVRTTALSTADLHNICEKLDWSNPTDVCFGAQIITAFFLALRTEDHVDGRLRWGDVYPQATDVEFVLPPGKSVRVFRHVAVAARSDILNLLPWLSALASFLPDWARAPHRPVFVSFAPSADGVYRYLPAKRAAFTAAFKAAVRASVGKNPALYAGYSLRRGGVTAMLAAGIPVAILKRHVGWAPGSEAFNLYYDHSGYEHKRMPTRGL